MATLNSASSLEQIQASYDDNASYAEDMSVPKAKAFVTACRMLIRRTPKATGSREAQLTLSPDLIQKEMQTAIEWIQANDTGESAVTGSPGVSRTRTVSFENFR